MTDATLNRFLGNGTNAARLAFTPSVPTPASGPAQTYYWYETDTGDTYAYAGGAWSKINIITGAGAGLFSAVLSAKPTKAGTGLSNTLGTSATATDIASGVNFDAPGAGGIYTTTVPGTPYSISALLAVNNPGSASIPGMGWTDGTKIEFIYPTPGNPTTYGVLGFSNISTFGSTRLANTNAAFMSGRLWWWKIKDDGTNVIYSTSADGAKWIDLYTVAKSSGYLGASGYTHIFIGSPGASAAANVSVLSWTQGT